MRSYKTKNGYELTQVLSGRSNVFLLIKDNENILIDTGRKAYREKLISNLRSIGIRAIDYLVLTHTHYDHAESAEFFKRNYRPKIFVHSSEAEFLARGRILLPNGKSLIPKGTTLPTKILASLITKRTLLKHNYMPCEANILVEDLWSLPVYNFETYILHTPGHSIGSMSIIIDNEIAVVGDTMFGVIPNSIFPPFAQDVKEMVRSWGKLLDTKCGLFLPMHGFPRKRSVVERSYRRMSKKFKIQ
jgi:hydroxyacylglutathione hydrolase